MSKRLTNRSSTGTDEHAQLWFTQAFARLEFSSYKVLALAVGLTILLPALLAYLVAQHAGPRAQLRTRLAAIAGAAPSDSGRTRPQLDRARLIRSRLQESGHEDGKNPARRVQLRLRGERAGLTVSLCTVYIVSGLSGALATLAYLALGYPPLFAPTVVAVMGFGLPRAVLDRMARRRQKRFTQFFADALDIIIRGIRSGLPVSECLTIVGRESPEDIDWCPDDYLALTSLEDTP